MNGTKFKIPTPEPEQKTNPDVPWVPASPFPVSPASVIYCVVVIATGAEIIILGGKMARSNLPSNYAARRDQRSWFSVIGTILFRYLAIA